MDPPFMSSCPPPPPADVGLTPRQQPARIIASASPRVLPPASPQPPPYYYQSHIHPHPHHQPNPQQQPHITQQIVYPTSPITSHHASRGFPTEKPPLLHLPSGQPHLPPIVVHDVPVARPRGKPILKTKLSLPNLKAGSKGGKSLSKKKSQAKLNGEGAGHHAVPVPPIPAQYLQPQRPTAADPFYVPPSGY